MKATGTSNRKPDMSDNQIIVKMPPPPRPITFTDLRVGEYFIVVEIDTDCQIPLGRPFIKTAGDKAFLLGKSVGGLWIFNAGTAVGKRIRLSQATFEAELP